MLLLVRVYRCLFVIGVVGQYVFCVYLRVLLFGCVFWFCLVCRCFFYDIRVCRCWFVIVGVG